MNVDLGIWSKLSRLLLVLLVLATLVVVALWYVPLIRNNESLRKRKFLLEQHVPVAHEMVTFGACAFGRCPVGEFQPGQHALADGNVTPLLLK